MIKVKFIFTLLNSLLLKVLSQPVIRYIYAFFQAFPLISACGNGPYFLTGPGAEKNSRKGQTEYDFISVADGIPTQPGQGQSVREFTARQRFATS
jgi:hypothetical protein